MALISRGSPFAFKHRELFHPAEHTTRALAIIEVGSIFMAMNWDIIEPTDSGILQNLSKKFIRDGEKALMLAVLQNAVEDFQKYVTASSKKGKGLFDAAETWILETNSPSFFSFNNICEYLEFDPDYIRKGFMRWKDAKRSQPKECANKLKSKAA